VSNRAEAESLRAKIAGWIVEETGVTGGTVHAWLRKLAALSDMKGKPPHYGPGSGERPQGGVPVQDGG
jgi:hypothetical protein